MDVGDVKRALNSQRHAEGDTVKAAGESLLEKLTENGFPGVMCEVGTLITVVRNVFSTERVGWLRHPDCDRFIAEASR